MGTKPLKTFQKSQKDIQRNERIAVRRQPQLLYINILALLNKLFLTALNTLNVAKMHE